MDGENPLRRARLVRGLSLADIIAETRLAPHIAEKIDDGRFGELPPGLYARAYVRAFARAAGVDADPILAELSPHLPGAPDPLPLLRELAREPGIALPPRAARSLAAAIDGATIGAMTGLGLMLVETFSGIRLPSAGASGTMGMVVLIALVAVPYFLILAGIAGRTPGQQLAGSSGPGPFTRRLLLRDVAHRAGLTLLLESSIVVDLVTPLMRRGARGLSLAPCEDAPGYQRGSERRPPPPLPNPPRSGLGRASLTVRFRPSIE